MHVMLKKSFGVGEKIDPQSNWLLEVFKNIETSEVQKPASMAKKFQKKFDYLKEDVDEEFAKEWSESLALYSKAHKCLLEPLGDTSRASIFTND